MKGAIFIYALIRRLLTYIFYGSSIDKFFFWQKLGNYSALLEMGSCVVYLFFRTDIKQHHRIAMTIYMAFLITITLVSVFMSRIIKRRIQNKIKTPSL